MHKGVVKFWIMASRLVVLTAAHKTLPFGTVVRVSSLLAPGREVDVRINDRRPFAAGRVIDLSQAAAEALGLLALGVADGARIHAPWRGANAAGPKKARRAATLLDAPSNADNFRFNCRAPA